MLHALGSGLFLGGLWLLLSGYFEAWLLWLALASVLSIVYIAHRMDVTDHEGFPLHLGPRALIYFPWLAWEVVKSNLDVAKAILTNQINPQVIHVKATQDSELGRTIYANSITLTPGTVTIGLEDDGLEVHALLDETAAGVETGDMDRRVSAMSNTRGNNAGGAAS